MVAISGTLLDDSDELEVTITELHCETCMYVKDTAGKWVLLIFDRAIASTNTAGIIKVGANLAIDANGVLSTPPPATNGALI